MKTHLGEEKENDNARESTNPRLNSEEYEAEESGGGKRALEKVERVNNNVLNPIRGLIYNLIKKKKKINQRVSMFVLCLSSHITR